MPYIIVEPCVNVKDRSCVDVCPVDCIYEGEDQLYIHPDECIDCGACEPAMEVVHREEQGRLPECYSARQAVTGTRHEVESPRAPR